jgi:hypothetical protein
VRGWGAGLPSEDTNKAEPPVLLRIEKNGSSFRLGALFQVRHRLAEPTLALPS